MDNITVGLASLFSLSRDAVIGVQNGNIAFMNPAAVIRMGGDSTGKPAQSILPDYILKTQAGAFMSSAMVGGEKATVSAATMGGLRVYMLAFEAQEKRGEVYASMATPIRTLLSNIKLSTERLLSCMQVYEDKRLMRYVSVLNHSYYQLRRLLLNISVADAVEQGTMPCVPTVVDIAELCRNMIQITRSFSAKCGIDVLFEDAGGAGDALVDRDLVEQMLLNLLSNSLLHTREGGRVKVTLTRGEDSLVFSVDDNGSGISPEVLPTVFSRWRENDSSPQNFGSAGVGLFVARSIAELHGGALVIESREGRGTCVRVMLPLDKTSDLLRSAETPYEQSSYDAVLTYLSTWLSSGVFEPVPGE